MPQFDALGEAKSLLRTARAAALATLAMPSGHPFASLVNVATAPDGSPILLLSRLAAHTRHLDTDPRLSLLLYSAFNMPSGGDPLTHPRLTILGRAERVDDSAQRQMLRARFLARHPKSSLYADFADFGFFRVAMETAHLNGGFGRAANLDADRILTPLDGAEQLVAEEAELLASIGSAEPRVAHVLAAALGGSEGTWQIIGCDPEGLDIGDGERLIRIAFPTRVTTGSELRQTIAALLAQAGLTS
ncbi:MAG: HugZ family pyridoxamine 5'-phosphate oxidase [Methylovirgula sp.]